MSVSSFPNRTEDPDEVFTNYTLGLQRNFRRLQKRIPGGLSELETALGIAVLVLMIVFWIMAAVSAWTYVLTLAIGCLVAGRLRKFTPVLIGMAAIWYLTLPLVWAFLAAFTAASGAAIKLRTVHMDHKPSINWALDGARSIAKSVQSRCAKRRPTELKRFIVVSLGEEARDAVTVEVQKRTRLHNG